MQKMRNSKYYTIGLDFGTLSARAVLVDVSNGKLEAVSVFEYPDQVIEDVLPGAEVKLPSDFALQNPKDYIAACTYLLRDIWSKAGIEPQNVIGIGVGFTASTVVAVDEAYLPLCMKPEFSGNPHSWVKLWKHHGAYQEAEQINEMAEKCQASFYKKCGGKINAELMIPKILETYRKAPEIYHAAYKFMEAADWLVWLLCGQECRSSSGAGLKAFWDKKTGYPDKDFFESIDEEFGRTLLEKLEGPVKSMGDCAGYLTEKMAKETGLHTGIAVSVGGCDAVLAFPALRVLKENQVLLTLGTSACYETNSKKELYFPGVLGVAEDALLQGYYGYDAGLTAVGDLFDWFVNRIRPDSCWKQALRENRSVFEVLNKKAETYRPGQSGLVALDWWHGNRSILDDSDLTGMIVGLSLSTKPEEIYRALIETAAFGIRMIYETFEEHGIFAEEIVVCGGLASKSKLVIQIMADVLGRELKVYDAPSATALGAAIYGAAAAGETRGGYGDIFTAGERWGRKLIKSIFPAPRIMPFTTSFSQSIRNFIDILG